MLSAVKVYSSKIDAWFIILSVIVFILGIVVVSVQHTWLGGIIILSVLALVIFPMLWNTYYRISNQTLQVQCGLLIHIDIDIQTITRVKATRSVWSAPALSLDRLKIFYNQYDSVVISPRQKEDFVALLKQINPDISIEW